MKIGNREQEIFWKRKKKLTSAFCFGEERQQITDAQPMASPRNNSFTSSSSAYVRDFPSMIRAKAS